MWHIRLAREGGPREATPINFRLQWPLKVACLRSVLLHYTTNVAGMSWSVRYGEVATLAQEFLEGLSPLT